MGPAGALRYGKAKCMCAPQFCGTITMEKSSPRGLAQNTKICCQSFPMSASSATQLSEIVVSSSAPPIRSEGLGSRRLKARWRGIRPPRQPRRRSCSKRSGGAALSFGFRVLSVELVASCETSELETRNPKFSEVEEEANEASVAVVDGIAVVLERQVHAPVQPNPLAPGHCVVVNWKIEQRSRRGVGCGLNQLVTVVTELVAEADVVLFLVALHHREPLRPRQHAARIGVRKPHAGFADQWPAVEVVSSAELPARGGVDGLALVVAQASAEHQLLAWKRLVMDDAVEPQLGNRRTANTAAGAEVGIKGVVQHPGPVAGIEPSGIAKARLAIDFVIDDVLRAREGATNVQGVPGRASADMTVIAAHFDVSRAVQETRHSAERGNSSRLRHHLALVRAIHRAFGVLRLAPLAGRRALPSNIGVR